MSDDLNSEMLESFEKFPSFMLSSPDVFAFEHRRATAAAMKLKNNSDLMDLLKSTLVFVERSDLPEERKNQFRELIAEEEVVVTFSNTSRRCIVIL